MPEENMPVHLASIPVVLNSTSTTDVSIISVQHRREGRAKGRVAALDLRIGLNMLGIEGRKLLFEYITQKLQQAVEKAPHPE